MRSKKVPEVRVAGFESHWVDYKLKDIVERITRKNSNLESTLPLTISAQDGLVDQNTFFNKQIASRDVSNYYLLENGEFAYNKSYSKGYPWGAIKRLDDYDKGVLSTLYIIFKPTKVESDFLVTYYDTVEWHKEVSMRAAEGARNHGLLNISAQDFFETKIKIPLDEKEQLKMGIFFKQLNENIHAYQSELESIKKIKQGFLQKMFPKEGESVPEVRFPGFTDVWKEKGLESVVDKVKSYSLSRDVETKDNTGYKYVHYGDIHTKVASIIDEKNKLPSIGIGDYSVLQENDIIVADASEDYKGIATPAVLAYSPNFNLVAGLHTIALRPRKANGIYLYYLFSSRTFKRYGYKVGTGMKVFGISSTNLMKFEAVYPSVEEQKKIGVFLNSLDKLSALHQRELDLLKQTKKAFLQKMFI